MMHVRGTWYAHQYWWLVVLRTASWQEWWLAVRPWAVRAPTVQYMMISSMGGNRSL